MSLEVLRDGSDGGDHVVLGDGAEAAVAGALIGLGAQRVLLVAMARHPEGAERLADLLGERHAGTFLTEVPQVPGEVADAAAERARALDADWVLAHGGGSAIGVAKAVALEVDVQVAAVPTTYAGSERTDIWGLTRDGEKTTGRDERVRPRVVGYDPALTVDLPVKLSLQSLLNAMAHSIDALYDADASRETRDMAWRSLTPLWHAINQLPHTPDSLEARTQAVRGAWMASEALRGASMAFHHKLAHVLGGSFGLPHAATHAALLPHTLHFNLQVAVAERHLVAEAFGDDDPAAALYDRMRGAGLAVSLRELDLPHEALPEVVDLVLARQYTNPRPLSREVVEPFVLDLWQGRRPSVDARRWAPLHSGGAHGEQEPSEHGAPVDKARKVVLAIHGRGANADRFAADLVRRMGSERARYTCVVALQADRCTWYPRGFRAPVADNQPQMDHALAGIDALWARLSDRFDPADIVVVGFSQGACLLLTWLQVTQARPRNVMAFTGAHTPLPDADWAAADGACVYVGAAADDPWVTLEQVQETVAALGQRGARVDLQLVPGSTHDIHPPDVEALRRFLEVPRDR